MASPGVKLPAKIWVGTYEFPVYLVPPDHDDLYGADGITQTHEDGRGIWINAALDDRKMLEIVWHEITHAINWNQDIDDTSSKKGARLNVNEETLVTRTARAWTQFLLDNPKFHRWLNHTVRSIQKERLNA